MKPSTKDIVGDWVGHDECAVEFLKLRFATNGTAAGAFCFADRPADVLNFTWTVKDYDIICIVARKDEFFQPQSLRLVFDGCSLQCTLSWGKAKREYILLKEAVLREKLQRADQALSQRRSSTGD